MNNSKEPEWLKEYYSRICQEFHFSLSRKDTLTNWALYGFFAMTAIYAELVYRNVPSDLRVGILILSYCLLLRFLFHSSITYGYIRKWGFLREQIEHYWTQKGDSRPSLDQIVTNIEEYDHPTKVTVRKRDLITAQLKTGFFLIMSIMLILLLNEIIFLQAYQWKTTQYFVLGFIIYVIYEVVLFMRYKRIQMPYE